MFSVKRHESPIVARGHRVRSLRLTQPELVEIRASQRTFEGAYMRTAISQFSFALVILKIFTSEFYSIGALFAAFGAAILLAAALRRKSGNTAFFRTLEPVNSGEEANGNGNGNGDGDGAAAQVTIRRRFRTSGNVVTFVTLVSVAAYSVLLWLILTLDG